MIKGRLDDRGQLSAEYLLLLVVILAILSLVTIPLVGKSIDASTDVSKVSDASNLVNSYANAVNVVYANGPGAKRTLNLYVPVDNMTVATGGTKVNITLTLSDKTNKTVSGNTSYTLGPHTFNLTKGWHQAFVIWSPGNNYISNWIYP